MHANNIRKPIKLIKSSEIKKNFLMPEAIFAMEEAFSAFSKGTAEVPQRYVQSFGIDSLTLLLKPAFVESENKVSIKIITQKKHGAFNSIPGIVGVVMVMDSVSGEVLSIMDGEFITALRTGAASGLATKYFARENASTMAIFGCGVQGKTQLEAVNTIRYISKVWVFDKNPHAAKAYISEMKSKIDAEIFIADDLDTLKECDIICTATNAEAPLFSKEHIKEGVHINAIGSFKPNMQEIDPEILKSASIFVDNKESCLAESGDLIKPISNGIFTSDHIRGEIGECALGNISVRKSKSEITVFKSVGVAIQDFMVATKIYEKSILEDFGTEINLFE